MFALLSWNLLVKANHLYMSGEVSMTLHIPYYPACVRTGVLFPCRMLCPCCRHPQARYERRITHERSDYQVLSGCILMLGLFLTGMELAVAMTVVGFVGYA